MTTVHLVAEILKTFEVEVAAKDSDKILHFRIEILSLNENPNKVFARLWSKDIYRLQPTFPQSDGQPSSDSGDELLLVEDPFLIDLRRSSTHDWKGLLDDVIEKLKDRFDLSAKKLKRSAKRKRRTAKIN
jgi:hypothetical protein